MSKSGESIPFFNISLYQHESVVFSKWFASKCHILSFLLTMGAKSPILQKSATHDPFVLYVVLEFKGTASPVINL